MTPSLVLPVEQLFLYGNKKATSIAWKPEDTSDCHFSQIKQVIRFGEVNNVTMKLIGTYY